MEGNRQQSACLFHGANNNNTTSEGEKTLSGEETFSIHSNADVGKVRPAACLNPARVKLVINQQNKEKNQRYEVMPGR